MREIRKRYTPEARQLIKKLPPGVKNPIRSLTDEILKNPLLGKELKEELKGFRSARYAVYRVIYEYNEEENWVTIHFVGHRVNIYRLFQQFLKKSAH